MIDGRQGKIIQNAGLNPRDIYIGSSLFSVLARTLEKWTLVL
jgi:hypothetical protein